MRLPVPGRSFSRTNITRIVTHNMRGVARVFDMTAFSYEGSLVESGDMDRLFTKPRAKEPEDYITGRFG